MFRAVYRSSSGALTVFAASGLHTHVVTGRSQVWVGIAVEPSMNGGIISSITRLHLVGYFYWVILQCTDPWMLNLQVILVIFLKKLEFSRQIFEKYSHIKLGPGLFHTNRCMDRLTNRHDEANTRFSQFLRTREKFWPVSTSLENFVPILVLDWRRNSRHYGLLWLLKIIENYVCWMRGKLCLY